MEMAVNKVPVGSSLRIQFQIGVDHEGNPVFRSRSLSGVKSDAADQDIYDVAMALGGLQDYTVNAVTRVDNGRLEEV